MSSRTPARRLLSNLHELMAARSSPQDKLDAVTVLVAEALQSDVASVYVLRAGAFELFATRGLNPQAVHVTRIRLGEGLVGLVARDRAPLRTVNAGRHPDAICSPETGEADFTGFAAVPIIRREQSVGVLVVQDADQRHYDDEEIEALQTVAMVLAELVAAAGLVDMNGDAALARRETTPHRIEGLKLVDGMGRGVAVFHRPRVEITNHVADNAEHERERLQTALARMRTQIDQMLSRAEFAGPGDHDEILETYRMFALDEGWTRRINAGIDAGLTAEAAVDAVAQAQRARLEAARDPYLQERIHDLDDLSNRLIRLIVGATGTAAERGLTEPTILVARNLGPAELLEYERKYLCGVALEEGSLTSHVTILARAMGVPVLGRLPDLRAQVTEGDPLLLDATVGALFVRPPDAVVQSFRTQQALKERQEAEFDRLRDLPAVSLDGVRVQLMMNAGLRSDLPALEMTNADGIGLFRTEFQFLVSATLPRKGRQIRLYKDVLQAAGDKPVVFRTVDIGGDKAVPYMEPSYHKEENPAMGWRAIRLALDRPGWLAAQVNALLQAAAGRRLHVMFPMIAEKWEFDQARAIVEDRRQQLERAGIAHCTDVQFGTMLEVPALAMVLDELLPELDFLSIGTNDLMQFLLAADRGNPRLADRYDWLSRALLRYLQLVIDQARAARVPVSVCGEMGGRPLEALALLALGVDRLSITPASIGRIKAMVRTSTLGPLRARMKRWLETPGVDIRAELLRAAEEQQIWLS